MSNRGGSGRPHAVSLGDINRTMSSPANGRIDNSSPPRRFHITKKDHRGSSPPGRRRQLPPSPPSYAGQSAKGSSGGQWRNGNNADGNGGKDGVGGRRRGWGGDREGERGSGNRGRRGSGGRGSGRDDTGPLYQGGDLRHMDGGRGGDGRREGGGGDGDGTYSPVAGPADSRNCTGPGGNGNSNGVNRDSRDDLPRSAHQQNRPPPPVVIEPSSGAGGVGREWESDRSLPPHPRVGYRPDDWLIDRSDGGGDRIRHGPSGGEYYRTGGGGVDFDCRSMGDRGGPRLNGRGGFRDMADEPRNVGGYPSDYNAGGHSAGHVVVHGSWDQPRRRLGSRDRGVGPGGGGSDGGSGLVLHGPPPGGWNRHNQGRPPHRSDRMAYDSRNPSRGNGNVSFGVVHGYGLNAGPAGPPHPLNAGGDSRDRQRRNDRSRSRSRDRGGGYPGRDYSGSRRDRNNGRMGGGGGGGFGLGGARGSYRRSPLERGRPRHGSSPPLGRSSAYNGRGRRSRGRGGAGGYGGVSPGPRGGGGVRDEYRHHSGGRNYRNGGVSGGRGSARYANGGGYHGGGGDGHYHSGYSGAAGRESRRDHRRFESRGYGGGGGGGWGGVGGDGGKGGRHGRSSSGRDDSGSGRRNGGGGGDHSGGEGDDEGHYKGKKGSVIGERFEVHEDVGLGTFGRVLECWDMKRKRRVAVKVVRKGYESLQQAMIEAHVSQQIRMVKKYHESALIEAQILRDVNSKERSLRRQKQSLCVEMLGQFEHQGHCCLVFECLGLSLYDYLKKNEYRGFPMSVLRPIAQELLQAIEFLHSIKLIHTDLKPENVLLKGWEERAVTLDSGETIRVPASPHIKVIDFGGATYEHDSHASVVNTRQYRAPEVILGLRWLYPSDLWSVGCIIAELFLGDLLFATHNNLEHLALMEKCVGLFPSAMLVKAPRTPEFFNELTGECRGVVECDAENRRHIRRMKSLQDITAPVESTGMGNLLEKLLTLDPKRRATATEALRHRFFDGL